MLRARSTDAFEHSFRNGRPWRNCRVTPTSGFWCISPLCRINREAALRGRNDAFAIWLRTVGPDQILPCGQLGTAARRRHAHPLSFRPFSALKSDSAGRQDLCGKSARRKAISIHPSLLDQTARFSRDQRASVPSPKDTSAAYIAASKRSSSRRYASLSKARNPVTWRTRWLAATPR